MKIIYASLILLFPVFAQSIEQAPKKYKDNQCVNSLVEIMGTKYKANGHDILTRLEDDGTLTVLPLKGEAVRIQPNGSCIPINKNIDPYATYEWSLQIAYELADKHHQESLGAKDGANSIYKDVLESCDAQENQSEWYKKIKAIQNRHMIGKPPNADSK
jgi:hypothetical protein